MPGAHRDRLLLPAAARRCQTAGAHWMACCWSQRPWARSARSCVRARHAMHDSQNSCRQEPASHAYGLRIPAFPQRRAARSWRASAPSKRGLSPPAAHGRLGLSGAEAPGAPAVCAAACALLGPREAAARARLNASTILSYLLWSRVRMCPPAAPLILNVPNPAPCPLFFSAGFGVGTRPRSLCCQTVVKQFTWGLHKACATQLQHLSVQEGLGGPRARRNASSTHAAPAGSGLS